jgi:hypothetical protein
MRITGNRAAAMCDAASEIETTIRASERAAEHYSTIGRAALAMEEMAGAEVEGIRLHHLRMEIVLLFIDSALERERGGEGR